MPNVTSSGSIVTGATIVDGTISNADISPSAAIAASKIAGLIGAPGSVISIESGTASTYALTTLAGQQVLVMAFAEFSGTNNDVVVNLQYNGVTKMTRTMDLVAATSPWGQVFAYTETPGAATQNLSFSTGVGSLTTVLWVIVKIQTS